MKDYVKAPALSTCFSESGKRAKERLDNILNSRAGKKGAFAFTIIALAVLTAGALVALNTEGPPKKPGSENVSLADIDEQSNEVYRLADIWAKAWMTRDGKARYDIMSSEIKVKFEAEQARIGVGDPFSIRWSSPWVISYTIQTEGNTALINYKYTDSTSAIYEGFERITIGQENGRAVVVGQNPDYEETIIK